MGDQEQLLEWCPVIVEVPASTGPEPEPPSAERCNARIGLRMEHEREDKVFPGDGPDGSDRIENVIMRTDIGEPSCDRGHTLAQMQNDINAEL